MLKALVISALVALNFGAADRAFWNADYKGSIKILQEMIPQAETDADKAVIEWRISRACLMLEAYEEGIAHAEEAIRLNPADADAYMWHCANVGREAQLHSVTYQASKVPDIEKDLNTILNKLGKTRYSEAWQALSELYWEHPFKSSDAAINYVRRAAVTIPRGELRLTTYHYLAKLLYKRNWSAEKKERQREANRENFANKKQKITARYAYYDGAPDGEWPWKSEGMSDREEARSVLDYALGLYRKQANPVKFETIEYNEIQKTLSKWK